jgi:FkbM family methyltransferase
MSDLSHESQNRTDYEPETIRIFNAVLKEGDQVIVCGAHQGYFVSICSQRVGATGRVFGFEPEPGNFSLLKAKCGGLENVELFNFALGDREVTAKLYVNSDNDGGHALWNPADNPSNVKTKENPQIHSVEVKTIDGVFDGKDLSKLKLLMLDAEGSEHSIIKGGINAIVDNEVPFIITEINNYALSKCQTSQMSLRAYLSMYGFTGYVMNEDKVIDINPREEVKAFIPNTEQEVVFNILFSRRGRV